MPLPRENATAILWHLEEVLCLQVGGHHCRWRHDDASDLRGQDEPDPAPVSVAVEDRDATLLLKGLELLVRGAFGHGLALLTDATSHSTASGLESEYALFEANETSVAEQVEVDGLLVHVQARRQMILKVLQHLLEVDHPRSL
jgi:hypothetical protein